MNIDAIMAELAQYIRMQEEAAAMVESLKDQLKERMTAAGVESLAGSEHTLVLLYILLQPILLLLDLAKLQK